MNIAKKSPPSNLAVALGHVRRRPHDKLFPLGQDKGKPLITNNLAQASNDPGQIKRWSLQFPGCWWGRAHKTSGLMPLDFDPRNGCDKTVADLKERGFEFPDAELIRTPSGGSHLIYACPDGFDHHFTAGIHSRIGAGIDSPNYTVIPGCGRYVFVHESPNIFDTPLPPWIVALFPPRDATPREACEGAIPLDVFKEMLAVTPYEGGPKDLDDRRGYEGWLEFAMACHEAAGGDEGEYLSAFQDWSLADPGTHGPNWDAEHIERHWISFSVDPVAGGKVTRGSWYKLLTCLGHGGLIGDAKQIDAEEENWPKVEEQPEQPEEPGKRNRLRGRTLFELRALPRPKMIVPGLIPEGLTVAYSLPKRGKSFYFIRLALAAGSATPFFGKTLEKTGKVLYLAAEGGAAQVQMRADRMIEADKLDADLINRNVFFVDTPIDLGSNERVDAFCKANADLGPFEFVIIDTLARNMSGDENSTKDMNAAVAGCDRIRRTLKNSKGGDSDVLLLHHQGWEKTRPRGAIALFGALDCLMRFERKIRDGSQFTVVTVEEMRDGAPPEFPEYFAVHAHGLVQIEASTISADDKWVDVLIALVQTAGGPVTTAAWREALRANKLLSDGGTGRSQWSRGFGKLKKSGKVVVTGTGKGQRVEPDPADGDFADE